MPTQYLSNKKVLTRESARYEVQMLADQLTPSGSCVDAFGRFRVSNPFTLFDSQFRYGDNGKWDTSISNSGNITYSASENVINMNVSQLGDEVMRETRRVMSYQPGKSLLVLMTAVCAAPFPDLTQRIGYYDENNGVYFENDGEYNYLKLRSASLNTTLSVRQDQWNGDRFDGTGYSGRTLDITKSQIFWFDIEWLGAGDVRCGFIVDGKPIVAHVFHNDNVRSTTYMSTACLPLRYEIIQSTNSGASGGAPSTLKQICATVISEGGYEYNTKQWSATRTTAIASTSVATGWAPVVSIRMASGRTGSVIIPSQIHITGDGNASIYEFALIRNATITGGSWDTHVASGSNVEYNIGATSMSGGNVEDSGIFNSSNQSRNTINEAIKFSFDSQLGRTISAISDVYTLAVRHLATGGNVYGSLNWNSLV
jgi:hypothetical protein